MTSSSDSANVSVPHRPRDHHSDWSIPLRSDPPWLSAGLVGSTLGSIAGFAAIFHFYDPRVPVGLSLLPGLTSATFLGAALSFWGRRKGGTLELYGRGRTLRVRSKSDDTQWLDARDGATFGALVLEDSKTTARVFVFTQGEEPTVVIDRSGAALSDAWTKRVVRVDFSSLAVSSESAGAIELAVGASSEKMLSTIEPALEDALWIRQRLPSGETLLVDERRLRVGDREVLFDGEANARRIAIATPAGEVLGLSIAHDLTALLFACVDPTAHGATADVDAPDAYLHPALFAALSAKLRAQDSAAK